MRKLTRREFLEMVGRQSAGASLAASFLLASCRSNGEQPSAIGLDRQSTQKFIDLLDEIIPASDGMPAASQAGTLSYLELLATNDPQLTPTITASLADIDALASDRFNQSFAELSGDRRQQVVAFFADTSPNLFGTMRTYAYEGYYLQPRVWELLGYEPYPTSAPGPSMEAFDPTMLDRVRSMGRRYREI